MSITHAYPGKTRGNKPTVTHSSIIRPENTTAYGAGDIIAPGDAEFKGLVFKSAFSEPGSGFLYSAQMQIFSDEVVKLDADLLIFDKPFSSIFVDNEPLLTGTNISKLEWQGYIGRVSFAGAEVDTQFGHCIYETNPSIIISSGGEDAYALLVAQNSYVPISAEEINLQLAIMPRSVG